MTIDDIMIGDPIEYTVIRDRGRKYERKGKVHQITDKYITVALPRYNETIGISDINPENTYIGAVIIPALLEENQKEDGESMANSKESREQWETLWPQAQKMIEVQGLEIAEVAKILGVDRKVLHSKWYRENNKKAESEKTENKTASKLNEVAAEPIQIESNDLPEGGNSSELKIVQPGALQNEGTIIKADCMGEPIKPVINYPEIQKSKAWPKESPKSTLVLEADHSIPVSLEPATITIPELKMELISRVAHLSTNKRLPVNEALYVIDKIGMIQDISEPEGTF